MKELLCDQINFENVRVNKTESLHLQDELMNYKLPEENYRGCHFGQWNPFFSLSMVGIQILKWSTKTFF